MIGFLLWSWERDRCVSLGLCLVGLATAVIAIVLALTS